MFVSQVNPIFEIRLERELNSSDGLYLSEIYKIFERLSESDVQAIVDRLKEQDKIAIKQYKDDQFIYLKG